jgi:hypothetical protein
VTKTYCLTKKIWLGQYCPVSTLHGLVLAVGGAWHQDASQNRMMLSVLRRKHAWFAGLWANASAPSVIHGLQNG